MNNYKLLRNGIAFIGFIAIFSYMIAVVAALMIFTGKRLVI